MRTYGSQSLVAPLKRVMVKRPTESAADAARWREFGYLHAPDAERLRAEHAAFVALVAASGAEVLYEDEIVPVPTELLDAIFVYDPAIVTDAGAIIGQPGKPLRRGEEEAMRRAFTDRNRYLGDPDFVQMPLDQLLSKEYAATLRRQIDPRRARSACRSSAPSATRRRWTAATPSGSTTRRCASAFRTARTTRQLSNCAICSHRSA